MGKSQGAFACGILTAGVGRVDKGQNVLQPARSYELTGDFAYKRDQRLFRGVTRLQVNIAQNASCEA